MTTFEYVIEEFLFAPRDLNVSFYALGLRQSALVQTVGLDKWGQAGQNSR